MCSMELQRMCLFLFALAFAKKDCSFWQSMNDCTGFTNCFWDSLSGTCNNEGEWQKATNKPSMCSDQGDMYACYSYMNCFWLAHKGTCEDVNNWSLRLGPTPDPMSRSCSFWDNSQDCWAIEKCFFDRRENLCKSISGGDSGSDKNAPATSGINSDFYQPITPSDGSPMKADDVPPRSPPGALFSGDTGVPTSSAPSLPPTEFWEPMNLCESLRDRKDCAYGDGCIWDVQSRRCLQLDGDCTALHSDGLCFRNEECIWDADLKECQSTCASITEEAKCAYSGEECFWDNGECVAINVRCDKLSTPSLCVHNDMCYWNELKDMCRSVFTSCTEMAGEADCGKNDHCLWNDEKQECEDHINHSTPKPMITCEDISDIEICQISNSTEHNMPCEWDAMQDKCVEYDFDCEAFETADTCNGANFRHIECYWKGECDQRKLAAPRLLQKALFSHSHSTSPTSRKHYLAYLLVFLGATIFGSVCGSLLSRSQPEFSSSVGSQDLCQPLDVTRTDVFQP